MSLNHRDLGDQHTTASSRQTLAHFLPFMAIAGKTVQKHQPGKPGLPCFACACRIINGLPAQKLLERLRTIGVVNHHFNHLVVGVRQASTSVVSSSCQFCDDDISARTSRRRAQNGRFAAQIETLALAFRRWQQRKNLPALLFTTINTSGAETWRNNASR